MGFWQDAQLACNTDASDRINEDIWKTSPEIHRSQEYHPTRLTHAGAIGAQQAMLDDLRVLPYVPDLLGAEWDHRNAGLIVGSAPAGFIAGHSGRRRVLSLGKYQGSNTWQQFQRNFLADVVTGDADYYERLSPLISNTRQFAILDLVRSSLVVRGVSAANQRKDTPINTRLPEHRPVFEAYAEHPKSMKWTADRFNESKARMIIALGFTAEYGLVRHFHQRGMRVRDSYTGTVWSEKKRRTPSNWTYAYPGRTLSSRFDLFSWWQVEDGIGRTPRWAIMPVVHPASWGMDHGYGNGRALLAAVTRASKNW